MMKLPSAITPRMVRLVSQVSLFVLVWAIVFWISATTYDPDFGWHLVSGQYIASHGIPTHDLFSYTMPTFRWINHEWLHDVLVARLYALGGYQLVAASFAGLWTLAIWLAGRRRLWFTTLLAVIALIPYLGIRPIIWSALGLVVLERLLEKRSWLRYGAIVGLFFVWANLHGSFALGLALLGAVAVVRRPVDVRLRLTALLAAAATLVNPYGWRVYEEIVRTLADSQLHSRIIEWGPIGTNPGFWIFTILLIALFWSIESHKRQWKFAAPAVLLPMAISSTRHCVLYVVVSLRYLETYLAATIALLPAALKRWTYISGAVLIIGLLIGNLPRTTTLRLGHYAPNGVAYLRAHPCQGNVFSDYDFGGYLIWKDPGTKTYIDGRMPSWSDSQGSIFARYDRVYTDATYRAEQFAAYDIRCVLISRATISAKAHHKTDKTLETQLKSDGWREAWSDANSLLLIRG